MPQASSFKQVMQIYSQIGRLLSWSGLPNLIGSKVQGMFDVISGSYDVMPI